jgi:U3 small nucleolar RNA-associated protein 11
MECGKAGKTPAKMILGRPTLSKNLSRNQSQRPQNNPPLPDRLHLTTHSSPSPTMSSMRNAVQRRNHKERAQPLERQKWGLLEKRKDYTKRAKDHNEKKRKLGLLKAKAADRNEDEFYFGMMNSSTKNGIKVAKRSADNAAGGGKSLSMDVVKLMKTQDVAYLRTVLQSTRKAIERLEMEVVAADQGVKVDVGGRKNRKTVFPDEGDSEPEMMSEGDDDDMADFNDLEGFDGFDGLGDLPALDDGPEGSDNDMSDAPETKAEAAKPLTKEEKAARLAAKCKRHFIETRRNKLEALKDREEDLATALRELEDQRVQMNGKAGGVNKNGTKFKVRQRVK